MQSVIAWHGERQLKSEVLWRLRADRRMDRFIQGTYWKNDRGCHLGCLTRSSDSHAAAERMFGIPQRAGYLLETVFEGLPADRCAWWALAGTRAIPVGADLSLLHHRFCAWLLGPDSPSAAGNSHPKVAEAVAGVRRLHERAARGERIESAAWSAAESAAWSACCAARPAAWSAWSAARPAVWSAAWSAARSAVESAAWSAARSAAESAAWFAAWESIAAKVIGLLRTSPVIAGARSPRVAAESLVELRADRLDFSGNTIPLESGNGYVAGGR